MRGLECFDALPEIVDAGMKIASDPKVTEAAKGGGTDAMNAMVKVIVTDHKEDAARLMAALKGVTLEEYLDGLTSPFALIKDVASVLATELATDFFTPSATQGA